MGLSLRLHIIRLKTAVLNDNSSKGGPADKDITDWVAKRANALLEADLQGVKRFSPEEVEASGLIEPFDYISHYVDDLENVIDMKAIADANIRIGVDPMEWVRYSLLGAYRQKIRLEHYCREQRG